VQNENWKQGKSAADASRALIAPGRFSARLYLKMVNPLAKSTFSLRMAALVYYGWLA
jgi:hypothetical protein